MFKFFVLLVPVCALMLSWVELSGSENIEVSDYDSLVESVAHQFSEWVKEHPEGVVVLPTGKLGENFIQHLKPMDTSGLKLVQQDEYFPDKYARKKEYLPRLNIAPENLLLLEGKSPEEIEKQIAAWGGIGFFFGEIGLEGNVGYLSEGKTKIVEFNYSQAAQAAKDFGGIDHTHGKSVITLGLDTVMRDPKAQVILFAAGESKGEGVAALIESGIEAQFLLTEGAACCLDSRKAFHLNEKKWREITDAEIDDVIISIALKENKEIIALNQSQLSGYQSGATLLSKYPGEFKTLLKDVQERLIAKIERGMNLPTGKNILHTSPHHDDIMLSYHPLLKILERDNRNNYAYFTSGYNAVPDNFMLKALYERPEHEFAEYSIEIFKMSSRELLDQFIEASVRDNEKEMLHWENLHFLHNTSIVFGTANSKTLKDQVHWLKTTYFPSKKPGGADTDAVSVMKGAVRESESERMLLMVGAERKTIHHLRLPFYGGNPISERDVKQVQDLYNTYNPDVITLALDPKSTGPDTHYKVLQINAMALQSSDISPKIWGYRNVWHRFKPADASIISPVSDQEMEAMNRAFNCCFTTQKHASFPAHNFDGPFSGLAEKIEREQYQQLKTLLGTAFFDDHPNPAIQNATGFVFIKEMSKEEFLHDYQGAS